MTLRELRRAYPELFYDQTWFEGEPFLDTTAPLDAPTAPPSNVLTGVDPNHWAFLPLAVTLAQQFVRHPGSLIWTRYLWCADTDRYGQRIYVGGATGANGGKFEIHRHLAINERWGVATWD